MNTRDNNEGSIPNQAFTPFQIGSRDQKGYVRNLKRMGFTVTKSLSEILANSYDAKASFVHFQAEIENNRQYLMIIDDGIGMGVQDIRILLDAQRQNHLGEQSMGISGTGVKPSLLMISTDNAGKYHPSNIYTKKEGDKYICVEVPWNKIMETELWDGMSTVRPMTQEEIVWFCGKLSDCGSKTDHGTIIHCPMNSKTVDILEEQFREKHGNISINDWWPIVYGKINMDIRFNKGDGTDTVHTHKYDYMSAEDFDYYVGKKERDITVYRDMKGNLQFGVLNEKTGKYYGYENTGKNTKTNFALLPDPDQIIGLLSYESGARINLEYFNPRDPKRIVREGNKRPIDCYLPGAGTNLCPENSKFFGQENFDSILGHLMKTKLYRNGQCVTMWKVGERIKGFRGYSSGRGSGKGYCEIYLLQVVLSYRCESSQKNEMDFIMGIEQNKSQNQNSFDAALERLLNYLRDEHSNEIWKYFEVCCANAVKKHDSSRNNNVEVREEDDTTEGDEEEDTTEGDEEEDTTEGDEEDDDEDEEDSKLKHPIEKTDHVDTIVLMEEEDVDPFFNIDVQEEPMVAEETADVSSTNTIVDVGVQRRKTLDARAFVNMALTNPDFVQALKVLSDVDGSRTSVLIETENMACSFVWNMK